MSVKLRSKTLADGSVSLYLDLYIKGSRYTEFLDIKLKKRDPGRKQKLELAEAIRLKRELEVLSDQSDVSKKLNSNDNFLK